MALFNIKGNDVNHVLMSEATRAMAAGAKTTEEKRNALECERQELIARIQETDVELSDLNSKISGRKLPDDLFRSMTNQQVALKRIKQQSTKRLSEITPLLKEKNRQMSPASVDVLLLLVKEQRETNRLLKELIEVIKEK